MTSASDRDFQSVIVGPDTTLARPEPTGSRLDAWWGRMLSTPARQRAWAWGGPLAVTVLAAVLRLWNLGYPHSLVFDETYYVKDAYTLAHFGYEAAWPTDADKQFNAGDVAVFTGSPAFVVHPPLGKWMISLGLAVFGAESSVGWRITTAIIGILAVALLCVIAKSLFSSTLLATIAGGLMAIDGNAIVMSRVALLDNSVMFFVLLGFGAVLLDRRQSATRLARWLARRADAGRSIDWGPSLWWRPWLVAAGVAFGAATAVKWNGSYFLAGFAIYTLVVDAVARRRAGVTFWGTGTLVKQGPASFLLTVPVALAVFLTGWTGWFVTDGGYYRHWAEQAGNALTGALSWVPLSWQSFWHYQASAYSYNVGLHQPHSYQANPLSWLFLVRPTAMYYAGEKCPSGSCGEFITELANPLIWWAATAALFYLIYRLIRYREWRVGLILAGVAAGYLPWLLYLNRTVFQFYTIAFEPYLILGLVYVMGLALGSREDATWRRIGGIRVVAAFLGLAVLLSAFFYPVWTGMRVPVEFLTLHYWLPTWR
ncbi:phospholipid carrier-dependent glycosyltransferase [Parafrigoribacterium mesophilum]|uniref:dolichyl-phosphate-mannose--protein mannosyltransferase n=1 Tax=Parafrigoribacterium mesophilum TaxID=433646 RepID=UPI0031FDB4DC